MHISFTILQVLRLHSLKTYCLFFGSDISGGKPLEVEMAGIEYMNDDPAMVDVLYAKVHMKDGSNRWVLLGAYLRGL